MFHFSSPPTKISFLISTFPLPFKKYVTGRRFSLWIQNTLNFFSAKIFLNHSNTLSSYSTTQYRKVFCSPAMTTVASQLFLHLKCLFSNTLTLILPLLNFELPLNWQLWKLLMKMLYQFYVLGIRRPLKSHHFSGKL